MINESWRFLPHLFAQQMGGGRWKCWDYLRLVGNCVADVVVRGGRLLVELPPRHGKSELISHYTPAWFLGLWPEKWVILATYESDFAAHWGRRVRNLIEEKPEIGVKIRSDSSAAHRWETTEGGGMITAGFGGPIMGRGGNLLIVDDPFKNWQEAQSPTYRRRVVEWFKSTFYTRAEPGAAMIVLTTRWHEGDLAGYLEKEHKDRWEVVKFPALAEADDPLGRKEGEALCPARFDVDALLKIKGAIGSYLWAAMYQQRPAPLEGGVFKIEWWRRYKELPRLDRVIQSWDTAFKKGSETSFSVCETWGERRGDFFLLDVWRARVEYPELKRQTVALYDRWRPSAVLVEDKASGQSLAQDLKRETKLPIIPVKVAEGDKVTRAQLVSPLVEAGRVFLPERAPWLADFLDELTQFPNAEHDDQVDALSQALDWMRGKRKPRIRWI